MRVQFLQVAVASVCALCGCTSIKPQQIQIQDLSARKTQLIGATIVTEGCLSDSHHGAYIWPCGATEPNNLTLIDDPGDKVPELFMRTLGHLGGELEVIATGSLEMTSDKQIYFKIESISTAPKREP